MITENRSNAFDLFLTTHAQLNLVMPAPSPMLLIDGDDLIVTNALDRTDDPAVLISGDRNVFVNETGATLTGTGTGDRTGNLDGAIEISGTGNEVQNEIGATVTGVNGIVATGSGTTVVNAGDVLTANLAVPSSGNSTAIGLGVDSDVRNSGLVRAEASNIATAIRVADGGAVHNSGIVEAAAEFSATGIAIARDGLIVNSGDVSVTASSNSVGLLSSSSGSTVENFGTIHASLSSSRGNAFGIGSFGDSTIWNGGTIEVTAANGGTAFGLQAFGGNVENAGTINVSSTQQSDFAQSVGMFLISASASNAGTILASSNDGRSIGVAMGGDVSFTNSGEILATGPGALGFSTSGVADITNSGTITAIGSGAKAIQAAGDTVVVNDGVISAESPVPGEPSVGISFETASEAQKTVINSGTIEADLAILDTAATPFPMNDILTIENSGLIVGAVDLGNGVDIVLNTGLIDGDVDLGSGNDVFDGRGGAVDGIVSGGDGDDVLRGGAGNDVLMGGAGIDIIAGGAGADVIDGGTRDGGGFGFDALDYSESSAGVQVNLGDATLSTSAPVRAAAGTAFGGDAEGDTFQNIQKVIGSAFDDFVYGASRGSVVELGDGNDVFDNQSAEISENLVYLGAGNDLARGGAGADLIDGGSGNDRLFGEDDGDWLLGQTGNDLLSGGGGGDLMEGGGGRDWLFGGADGDFLLGQEGNDHLFGGLGDDRLDGGTGNDLLVGGAGNDFFVFGPVGGNDMILDFQAGAGSDDVVDLTAFNTILSFDDVLGIASQTGGDDDDDRVSTVLTFDADTTLTFTGVRLADLNEADFIIA